MEVKYVAFPKDKSLCCLILPESSYVELSKLKNEYLKTTKLSVSERIHIFNENPDLLKIKDIVDNYSDFVKFEYNPNKNIVKQYLLFKLKNLGIEYSLNTCVNCVRKGEATCILPSNIYVYDHELNSLVS